MKLTLDQKEQLNELMASETWPALLALCELLLKSQEDRVLNYDLNQGPRRLVIMKAQLEGARALVAGLSAAKASIKKDMK